MSHTVVPYTNTGNCTCSHSHVLCTVLVCDHFTQVKSRLIKERPYARLSPAQVMHNRFLQLQKAALQARSLRDQSAASHQRSASKPTKEFNSKRKMTDNVGSSLEHTPLMVMAISS